MYGDVDGVRITRGENRANVYKMPDSDPTANLPNTEGYGNAGMILRDVQLSDSNVYRSKVFFKSGSQLPDTTNLTVVEGKSVR